MNNYIYDYSKYENNYNFNYSQYKKTINKKNNFSFTFILLSLILLLGLCIFLSPKQKINNNFYYVEIDNFQTYKEAISLSCQLQNLGNTGYIYFDNLYHVFISFYSTFEDAEKVVNNLKNDYPNSKVFSLSFSRFDYKKNLKNIQNSAVENFLNTTHEQILQLELLSNNFDSKKTSYNETKILIANYLENYTSVYNDFLENFKTNSKYNKIKEYANNILISLNEISKKEQQEFSAILRYETINISITFARITSSL